MPQAVQPAAAATEAHKGVPLQSLDLTANRLKEIDPRILALTGKCLKIRTGSKSLPAGSTGQPWKPQVCTTGTS
jgi:hypothetical protein